MHGVEKRDPALFADAYKTVQSKLIPLLEKEPSTSDDWSEPVANWNFDTTNNTVWASACLVANSKNPEVARLAFDNFYTKRPDR